jgi:hypothetical protein
MGSGGDFSDAGLIDWVNVPPSIGTAYSAKPEMAGALATTLGLEDLHDLLEVIAVNNYNNELLTQRAQQERERRSREGY